MKKTISINLNRTVFQIDEDAYQTLSQYLDAVSNHLEKDGQAEVMNDIEARIAELFTERLSKNEQVVTIELVNDIIGIMGRPADYGSENSDSNKTDGTHENYTIHSSSKRIYRDPEKAILGGVLSGFAIYLGMDVVWLRIIFALLVIFGVGTIIPIYLVLWLVIPKAETTAQRMEMHGIDVTIENFKAEANKVKERVHDFMRPENIHKKKEQIKTEAFRVRENMEGYVQSRQFQEGVSEMGSAARRVSRGLFRGVLAFLAGTLGLAGAIVVIGLVISLILSLIEPNWVFNTFSDNYITTHILSSGNVAMVLLALLVLIGVPVFMLFYAAIKILSGDAQLSSTSKWVALLLWLAGLFLLVSLSSKFAFLQWF